MTTRLAPKEHGAYGQLVLPIAAALGMGRPTFASFFLTLAAVAAFVAHEPVRVLLGTRGRRARREHGARAARWGLALAVCALGCAALAIFAGGTRVLIACAIPAALVVSWLPLMLRAQEKTLAGELMAASLLAAASIPIAIAGGVAWAEAWGAWLAWTAAFAVATAAVRGVVAHHKKGRSEPAAMLTAALATAMVPLAAVFVPTTWAAVPVLLVSWLVIALRPSPRRLKAVGWTLVASSAVTAALAVTLARACNGDFVVRT